MYLLNSLPARLLARGAGSRFLIEVITLEEAKTLCSEGDVYSALGHEEVAEHLSDVLDLCIPMNRITLERIPDDGALIANYVMPKRRNKGDALYTPEEMRSIPLNWILVKPIKGE